MSSSSCGTGLSYRVEPQRPSVIGHWPEFQRLIQQYADEAMEAGFAGARPDMARYEELWFANELHSFALMRGHTLGGFAAIRPHKSMHTGDTIGQLETIYVDPAHRSRGAGILVNGAVQTVKRDHGYLYVSAYAPNKTNARFLFQHLGRKVGEVYAL